MLSIIGCGNLTRSDDGVGVVVTRRLMESAHIRERSDVSIFDAGTGGMEVMFKARGARKLVIVDANRSDSEPGAIFTVPGEDLARDYEPVYSLHDFRWDNALYAGRKIYGDNFPTDITVFLIEAGNLGYGLELTEPVQRAAGRVVAHIEAIIHRYATVTVP